MQTTLLHLPSTPRHRAMAAAAAALSVIAAVLVWPHAKNAGPVIPAFLPVFATWVTVTEGLTALLLWTQYAVSGRLLFAALSGAYAFTSVIAAIQLLVFPGIFSPTGLLGAGPQTAIWIWVFWHGGFPALVTASLISRSIPSSLTQRTRGRAIALGAVALALALCALATAGQSHLPPFVAQSGSYAQLSSSPAGLIVEAISLAALGLHVSTTRLRSLMDLWLGVALLGALIDVTLTLSASARYSVGWYAARGASMVSSSAVLGMLIYETMGLYQHLSDTHRRLVETSARDGLTGVFNRAYFDERFAREFSLASASSQPLCVLLIDVDHFKQYNDAFGHLAGDECLKRVASALASALRRQSDFVARYGGEEFVVVLPACEQAAALRVGQSLRTAVEQLGIPSASPGGGPVTVSIGVACTLPNGPETATALLGLADAALYRAKARGRNRVVDAAELSDRTTASKKTAGSERFSH
ncbi:MULTISPECIES: sensor domain-containing diguanylate cyclase [unclassified Caballeronia]|uniref:sensor domain-containing diguanylate cyclase n=1 Tax=unclassified Caballeronia TaxID=2646786 RepID=UPI0020299749|nr:MULTISPECIES: sensor domain-containing diguanylate cyclase [unclassified Caballeronia]